MSRTGSERLFNGLFFGIVLATVLDRAWMVHLTQRFGSDDLTVIWLASVDYAHGRFQYS